jgi:tRNA pseudouridine65 synthase
MQDSGNENLARGCAKPAAVPSADGHVQAVGRAGRFTPACDHAAMELLYRDDALVVVDKPAGLMVHDSALARGETDFAADRLRETLGGRVHLVHRLDRATSGCLLVALEREVASDLGRQFMAHTVRKRYLAVCRGWPEAESFVVDHALDGGPGKPEKKPARTHFMRLACGDLDEPAAGFPTSRYALLECEPETGRFRQIRRHLKHLDHHLVGDTRHGDGRRNLQFRRRGVHRMLLHAWSLQFTHPGTGVALHVVAPLDAQWRKTLEIFGWDPATLVPGI